MCGNFHSSTLQAALQRGGGAGGREVVHVRGGNHFVNAGESGNVGSLAVGSGRNVTVIADYNSQVWGKWVMQVRGGVYFRV